MGSSKQKIKRLVLVVSILLLLWLSFFWIQSKTLANETGKRLGFKVQVEQQAPYTSQIFFEAMFLTEPYPAFLMMYIPTDRLWQFDDWIIDVATRSMEYSEIKILITLSWDMALEGEWTDFTNFLDRLQGITSVVWVGVDGEHSTYGGDYPDYALGTLWNSGSISNDLLIQLFDRAKAEVENRFFIFTNYYLVFGDPGTFRSRYLKMANTPWPISGRESDLDLSVSSDFMGIKAGAIVLQMFPGPDPPADPNEPVTDGGWSQEAVNRVIEHGMNKPTEVRQAIAFGSGISSTPFIGVSGRTTNMLWDNPLFRQWITEKQRQYPEGQIITVRPSFQLSLRVQDWDLTDSIQGASVYMNNGTQYVKVSDANGWANWTGVSGFVEIKVKYYGFWVNGTFSVNVNSNKTIEVQCRLYDVTVTVKPYNEQGVITTVNVTVFNSTSDSNNKIGSGITANWTGGVTLINLPNSTLTFTVYAKSDYSTIIANTTQMVSSEDQTFNIVANQNYGGVGATWEIIVYVGLILSQSRKVKRKRGLGVV